MNRHVVRFAIPDGSLEDQTRILLAEAGVEVKPIINRRYIGLSSDPRVEILLLRPPDAARALYRGDIDVAILGNDWLREEMDSGGENLVVDRLGYSKTGPGAIAWTLALAEESPINTLDEFIAAAVTSRKPVRIATELPRVTRDFFARRCGTMAADIFSIEKCYGKAEALIGAGFDAIVDVSESGGTFTANDLKAISRLVGSTSVLATSGLALNYTYSEASEKRAAFVAGLRDSILSAVQARTQQGPDLTRGVDDGFTQ